MRRLIHEIINLKSRREVLRAEEGDPQIRVDHLSSEQRRQMEEDQRRHINPGAAIDLVDATIRDDEKRIRRTH
jgi:hypothetical protein